MISMTHEIYMHWIHHIYKYHSIPSTHDAVDLLPLPAPHAQLGALAQGLRSDRLMVEAPSPEQKYPVSWLPSGNLT